MKKEIMIKEMMKLTREFILLTSLKRNYEDIRSSLVQMREEVIQLKQDALSESNEVKKE